MRNTILVTLLLLFPVPSPAQQPEGSKATVTWLRTLQNKDGGFRAAAAEGPSTLGATSAAIRAIKYLGGEVPDAEGAHRFIVSCFDRNVGGCSDTPGGKPDIRSTAVGIMAAVELGLPVDRYEEVLIKFLSENATDFEGIRIAVAGLESLRKTSPKSAEWQKTIEGMANTEGTWGKGDGAARDTGGSAVILLRLGAKLKNETAVLKVLETGLRSDGGYGKADAKESDLETTYRVLRCYHMLKVPPPGAAKIREFVTKCRTSDGSYGVSSEQPGSVSGTYFAATITKWLDGK